MKQPVADFAPEMTVYCKDCGAVLVISRYTPIEDSLSVVSLKSQTDLDPQQPSPLEQFMAAHQHPVSVK